MAKLKFAYDLIDDVPESFRELYEQRGARFELTGVEGVKTQADVDRVMEALRKERTDHATTRDRVKSFGEHTPEAIQAALDENAELKVRIQSAGKGLSDEQINEIVEKRIAPRLAPLQREIKTRDDKIAELTTQTTEYTRREDHRAVLDSVRESTAGDKRVPIHQNAMPDVELLAERVLERREGRVVVREDNPYGFTPGLAPKDWLLEVQQSGKRPLWFEGHVGAGAGGSGGGNGGLPAGQNPFDPKNVNLTAVGNLVKTNPQLAVRLAVQAKNTSVLPPELRPKQ